MSKKKENKKVGPSSNKANGIVRFFAILSGVSGLVVLIIFSVVLAKNYTLGGKILPEETGITGDFIGGVVGTLWSLTSMLMFYLALRMQREDLKTQYIAIQNQTEELKTQAAMLGLQRDEMARSASIAAEQSESMKLQKFETTFFNLIRNHTFIIEALPETVFGESQTTGHIEIKRMANEVRNSLAYLRRVIDKQQIDNEHYLSCLPDALLNTISDYAPIAEDTILLIEFIGGSGLPNTTIYQRILLNSMTPYELFLFGFYVEFSKRSAHTDVNIPIQFLEKFKKDSPKPILSETILPPKIKVDEFPVLPTTRFFIERHVNELHVHLLNLETKSSIRILGYVFVVNSEPIYNELNIELKHNHFQAIYPFKDISLKHPYISPSAHFPEITLEAHADISTEGVPEYTIKLCKLKAKMRQDGSSMVDFTVT